MPEIIVDFGPPPRTPWHLPHLPSFGSRSSKLITAGAAVVISISLISFTIFSIVTNNSDFKKQHGITSATDQAQTTSGTSKSLAALPGGGVATGIGGTSGTNAPVVTLTAQPASVAVGGKTHLKWSVTNNPKSCVASDDWSGNKSTNGEEDTAALTKVQTYIYTLTCKTATGTGFATVSVGATSQGGTGDVATRPTVTLAANPSSVYTGLTSTLSWSATNNPSKCTASGDWSGDKIPQGGAEPTAALTSLKSYKYTLTCSNSAGTGYATATVQTIEPPADVPLVTISSNPIGPVTQGTSVTLSWEATNSPTSCTASGDWSGAQRATGSYNTGALTKLQTYTYTLTCSNGSGSSFSSVPITVVLSPPSVSLSVSPSSITVGSSTTISWRVTNSPTNCTASGDWSGAITPTSSGTRSFTATTAKTYVFSLSCTNSGGTGYQNNVPLTATNPAAPVVTISASPISVNTGGSANITWSATNSPTSCTAGGTGWAGTKNASGTASTGVLNVAGTYTYSLSCSNAGGTGSASTSVTVSSGATASPPVVTISVSPASIGTGSSATVSWSATNSPTSCTASGTAGTWATNPGASGTVSTGVKNTAGTFTYTLTCSNSAGSGSSTATLTVTAVPIVTISVNPTALTAGASATATVTWSATSSPTSCSASGNWTGARAASGSAAVGPITTAGTYTYSLTCSNSGGTGPTASAYLTATAPVATYCSGNLPCYSRAELATHNTQSNCWGYNGNRAINVTSLNSGYHRSRGNLLPSGYTGVCGNVNLAPFLSGGSSIPGIGTHNHNSGSKNNTGIIATYLQGWYDATKP